MVTSIYAALLGFMMIFLSVHVVRVRQKLGLALGDGNDFELKRRIRTHANFAEYAPMYLVLSVLCEWQGAPRLAIAALGALFVMGRIAHAYSMLKNEIYVDGVLKNNPLWRICGMVCTFSTIGIISVLLLLQYFYQF